MPQDGSFFLPAFKNHYANEISYVCNRRHFFSSYNTRGVMDTVGENGRGNPCSNSGRG